MDKNNLRKKRTMNNIGLIMTYVALVYKVTSYCYKITTPLLKHFRVKIPIPMKPMEYVCSIRVRMLSPKIWRE